MYVAEGELLIATNPESYLGQFGVFHAMVQASEASAGDPNNNTHEVRIVGASEHTVDLLVSPLRQSGDIPPDIGVEHITTLEQARKYASPAAHQVKIAWHRMPDLAEALDDQVPEGSELLGGSLQFWKELRLPTAKVYVAALGRLIAQVEYSPGQGWHNKFDKVKGTRRVLGLVTPSRYRTTTKTNVTGYGNQIRVK